MRWRYPSSQASADTCGDGFREELNPSYGSVSWKRRLGSRGCRSSGGCASVQFLQYTRELDPYDGVIRVMVKESDKCGTGRGNRRKATRSGKSFGRRSPAWPLDRL